MVISGGQRLGWGPCGNPLHRTDAKEPTLSELSL